jgi:beta-galactosidase
MPNPDEFLSDLYDSFHLTTMQQKLRRIAPMPVGVVFIQHPDMSEDDIRGHFRLMKQLGFTCLKGAYPAADRTERELMRLALEEGIIPWWYDQGGWEEITDELLMKLGITLDTPIQDIRRDERFLSYQNGILRDRIDGISPGETSVRPEASDEAAEDIPFSFDMELHDNAVPHFVSWLRKTYGTIEDLHEAWNLRHMGFTSWLQKWLTWEDLEQSVKEFPPREYRHLRDIVRFKADVYVQRLRARVARALGEDRNAPTRAGGEMGLFLPFAARATDMEGIAEAMAHGGSFYPSIHLSWHFEEVDFEIARPVYMQASLVQDWFKGGWSAAWESTGGPQQLSGGRGHLHPPAAAKVAGFTVDEGVTTQLMLSYLAAGFKGFGFWCWNSRSAGWEAGEYAMLDRQNQPTPRAIQAGRIGQAAQRYRDELWKAHKEPMVGLLVDFDNDAMWAAISASGRDRFKHFPMQARVGAARSLIDHNVPWEHVTASDLRNGLTRRYKTIYLPGVIALGTDLLTILAQYVEAGGRVVIDAPSCWYNEFGRLLPTGPGTTFEKTFGCSIRDFQYSSNVPRSLDGRLVEGFVLDLALTHAGTVAKFDNGQPAITEAKVGAGTAVVMGLEASLMCFRPGNAAAEDLLVGQLLGARLPGYSCAGAIVYRLAAPQADHYFLINDGPATAVRLETPGYAYSAAIDAITQEPAGLGAAIDLPPYGGRWVRLAKA